MTTGNRALIGGRYEVLQTISAGPHGSLRKALDHQLGRTVALKTLVLPESSARDDFLAETKILYQVDPHPGLPRLRTDLYVEGDYVIVMDWVEGTDLAEVLAERGDPGLRKSAVVDYIAQVAAALDHLHSHDPPIVHGDVKPSNLVLTANNKIVLLDFGIARLAGQGIDAGTRGFMAPEVSAGQPCGPPTDVYGLASTAYALLTGSPPSSARPDWEGVDREDLAALTTVFTRALTTDPRRRYASAGEFAERLRAGRGALPTGVVTLVALEIVDADDRWEADPSLMSRQADRVTELVGTLIDESGGILFGAESGGDRFLAVFTSAASALRAAWQIVHDGTNAASARDTGLEMRAGLYTGEPERRDGAYAGSAVARTQRLRSRAERGGVLMSGVTAELVREHVPAGTRLHDVPPSDSGEGNGDRAFALVARGGLIVPEGPPASKNEDLVPPAVHRHNRLPTVDDPECARLEREIRNALGKQDVAARAGQDKLAAKWGADAALLAQAVVERRRQIDPTPNSA